MGARAKVVPPASGRTAGLWAFELAMASARTARCSTAAGALDTYAKGVLLDNGIYIAMASPLSAQAALADQMRAGPPDGQTAGYTLQGYLGGSWARASAAYKVFNLQRQDDGSYSGLLVFRMDSLIVDARGTSLKDESGGYPAGVVWFPVRASNEDGWVVERTGETEHWA
jgi:hypothetical protein